MRFSKQQLIDALEAKRATLAKIDKAEHKAHQVKERAALRAYQRDARKALRFTYAQLRGMERSWRPISEGGAKLEWNAPSCPVSLVARLVRTLATIKTSMQSRYTVDESGCNRATFALLMAGAPAPKSTCDV